MGFSKSRYTFMRIVDAVEPAYTPYRVTQHTARSGPVAPGSARPRMRRFHNLFEPLACDMGINLRGGDVRMAQQGLNSSEIGATFDQMRCECMPHHMR